MDYYVAVGDGIMRALRERPTTLQRFPEGVGGEMFYQKRVPAKGVPPWLETVEIAFPSGRKAKELCPTDLAHVVWAAQMNAIVFHAWPVRRTDPDSPDELRIDLDPQPGTDFSHRRRGGRRAARDPRRDSASPAGRKPPAAAACTSTSASVHSGPSSRHAGPSSPSPGNSNAAAPTW